MLDLPGTLRKRLKAAQLAKVRDMSVPGKVVVALFESFKSLISKGDEKKTVTKFEGNEGADKRKPETKDLRGILGTKKLRTNEGPGAKCEDEKAIVPGSDASPEGKLPFRTVSDKATKADDAPAPVHLFDNRVLDALKLREERRAEVARALNVLRRFGVRLWKRNVRSSFGKWLRQRTSIWDADYQAMRRAGLDVCRRADGASCWDWDAGSALMFWRWPEACQRESWEGVPPRFVGDPPTSKSLQPPYEVKEVMLKVSAKL